jgi:thymidylate synthase
MSHNLVFNGTIVNSYNWDDIYASYLQKLMEHGEVFVGRNGETRSTFGAAVRVDLQTGFPLTRLRKMPFKNLVREFLFDVGLTQNVEALGPAKHFWDFLADENGELGASAYNRQWRRWPASRAGSEVPNESLVTVGAVDQLDRVMRLLRDTPNSRHGTVITTNPTAMNVACPPCHLAMQFMPSGEYLDVMVPARSNDMVVGFPLDIARYSIILTVMAQMTDFKPRFVYMPSANSHIYKNCYGLVDELLSRTSRPECQLLVRDEGQFSSWDAVQLDDFDLLNYDPHAALKVEVN